MCVHVREYGGNVDLEKTTPDKKYHVNLRAKAAHLPDTHNIKARKVELLPDASSYFPFL